MAEFLFSELEQEQESKRTVKTLEARRHAPATAPHVATPEKRATDRERLLWLLTEAGEDGVSSALLNEEFPQGTYTKRMSDLRKLGWVIDCEKCSRGNVFYLRGKADV